MKWMLKSVKGEKKFNGSKKEAKEAARLWQKEIQAAWGVVVENENGDTVYTAE